VRRRDTRRSRSTLRHDRHTDQPRKHSGRASGHIDAGTCLLTSVLLVALLSVGSVGCERTPSPNNAPPLQAPAGIADPLPSWNGGANKKSILEFVARVTDKGGRDFVPVEQRIATFDNDGTLWAEQPLYFQMLFMLEQVRAAAPRHPEWKANSAFKALASHDEKALAQVGQKPLLELIAVANSGMSVDVYDRTIRDWLATARHPVTKRRFTDMVYQPMLELLAHLRGNGFKTFIVSGGSVEFMRPWVERAYGIPPSK
jgi:haloacid dehalogenase-like hydrolase